MVGCAGSGGAGGLLLVLLALDDLARGLGGGGLDGLGALDDDLGDGESTNELDAHGLAVDLGMVELLAGTLGEGGRLESDGGGALRATITVVVDVNRDDLVSVFTEDLVAKLLFGDLRGEVGDVNGFRLELVASVADRNACGLRGTGHYSIEGVE
jgi:hypothetical protein